MRIDPLDQFRNLIQSYVRDNVNTHLPAKVVAVKDFGTRQTVDVNVQLSRLFTNGTVVDNENAIIYGVPVVFPSAGGGLLSFPVKVGDTVLLEFCQRGLENWLASDGSKEVIPEDSRHYSEADAIAIPGLYTIKSNLKPSTTDVELKFKNSSIRISPDDTITITNSSATYTISPNGSVLVDNGAGSIQLESGGNVNITAPTINLNGNVVIPSSLMLAGKEIAGHDHNITSGSSAPGPTGPNN